jgi:putative SOS response-associated peptidase YedK
MCYSAMVWASYGRFVTAFKATISIDEFVRIYMQRAEGKQRIVIPKAMDASFATPSSPEEFQINGLIERYNAELATKTEAELFKQKTRLNTARRALETKVTKKSQEDVRIATSKIEQLLVKLEDLRRTEPKSRDSRIFSHSYAPVMYVADGERVVAPMRYLLRPHYAKPEWDTQRSGAYNARCDSLASTWRGIFGVTHAVAVVQRFYEHVDRDGRDAVLEFEPADGSDMLVACLWSWWRGADGEELNSFAFVTEDPPPEVAAAGHDRCPIPLKPENVDAWLTPRGRSHDELFAMLEDRHRPYYEHRLAA